MDDAAIIKTIFPSPFSLSVLLKRFRKFHNLRLKELRDLTGISDALLSMVENGRSKIRTKTFMRLLGVMEKMGEPVDCPCCGGLMDKKKVQTIPQLPKGGK